MSVQLPHPDQYSDWRDWAKAVTAQITRELDVPQTQIIDTGTGTPPSEFDNITIRDDLDRIILNPDGLWIWDPFGQLPIAPGIFAIDTQHLVDAAITTQKMQDLAVDITKLAELSVDASKLIDGSVTTTKIANLAVGTAAIAIGAIGTAQIANAAILNALIGDLAVTTGKIDNLAVNEGKIANASISSAKIQDLQVTNAKIANGAIDALKIGAAVINRTHIQDGEIVNAKIANVIQSSGWSDITKQGWRINKDGQIEGSGISIYDQYGYLVFGANSPVQSAVNVVRNGNFAAGLLYWGLYDNGGGAALTLVSGTARVTWGSPDPWPRGVFQPRPEIFIPNETFVVSFTARAVFTTGSSAMTLHWNTPPTEQIALLNPTLTSSWQRYAFRIKLGATVEAVALYIGTNLFTNTGYLEIDNVQMERGLWPTEWRENLTDMGETALWASITGIGKPADNADVTAANIAAGIAGQGALATQNSVNLASQAAGLLAASQVSGLGTLALQSTISLETQALGFLANSQVSGLGALALISQLTGVNISTYIQAAAIGTALIADAAILRAKIGDGEISSAKIEDAAITSAKIQALAVGTAAIADLAVNNAKIADATIASAKIANLVVDKLLSGNLDAVIEVANGRLQFTVGGSRLIIGNSFGSANQFLFWFGPNVAIASMTEANAVIYIKTDGSAYFGGTLSAGIIKVSYRTTALAANADVDTGDFGSLGGSRVVTISYNYFRNTIINNAATWTGSLAATVYLEKWNGTSWVSVTSLGIAGDISFNDGFPGTETGNIAESISGSFTHTDNTGGTTVRYRARVARTNVAITSTILSLDAHTQSLGITSVES